MTKSTCGWSIYLPRNRLKENSFKLGWRKIISFFRDQFLILWSNILLTKGGGVFAV